jgi:hypothetical protein
VTGVKASRSKFGERGALAWAKDVAKSAMARQGTRDFIGFSFTRFCGFIFALCW